MTFPSIETRQLTKRFGDFKALDKLGLKLEGGKCVGPGVAIMLAYFVLTAVPGLPLFEREEFT